MRVVKAVHGPTTEDYCEVPSAFEFEQLETSVRKLQAELRKSNAGGRRVSAIEDEFAALADRLEEMEKDIPKRIKAIVAKEFSEAEKRMQALDDHIALSISKLIEVEMRSAVIPQGEPLIGSASKSSSSAKRKRPKKTTRKSR